MTPTPRPLVLALVAQNENRTLEAASLFVGGELMQRGYEHRVIDMMADDGREHLKADLLSGRVSFVYALAGVGAQFTTSDNINLWTAARVPFIALWYDHPCYNYRQHCVDSTYVTQVYHVLDHMEVRRKYLNEGAGRVALLPVRFGVGAPTLYRPYRERAPIILYAKTGINPVDVATEWREYPPKLQDVLWSLVEEAQKNRNLDLADATATRFSECGQSIDNRGLFMGVIAAVDTYIRAWRSDRLARTLLRYPAHIMGRGWEYLRSETTRAEFLPPVSSYDYCNLIPNYRILANTNPLWRDGMHERVSMAICVGSVCLTDRTQKSDAIFGGLANYVGFEWNDNLDEAIETAFARGDDGHADFFAAADLAVQKKVLDASEPYVSILERIASNVRATAV